MASLGGETAATASTVPSSPARNNQRLGDNNTPRGRGRGGNNRGRGRGRGEGAGAGGGSGRRSGPAGGPQDPTNRGGRGGRGGRELGLGNGAQAGSIQPAEEATQPPPGLKNPLLRSPEMKAAGPKADGAEDDETDSGEEVCFICANPIIHHSVAPCNHLNCHICALRMRALYKNKDCPNCRTPAPYVIFSDDATKRFEDYAPQNITSTDDNIGIRYTSEEIVGDTVLLLRYNCPDDNCDYAGQGWPDLHRHVRAAHHKKMCDLCTRNKKVFTHEHELFTDKSLQKHMQSGDDRPGDIAQTGFKGHPLCGFCGERFYDDDKLYEHCRNRHERCFICDRRDSRHPHYYMDYNALEEHFKATHFLCSDRECMEKKFVVFESEMDLKAHQLSEHANSLTKDVRRDARVVDMSSFDFRPTYQQERRRGGGEAGGSNREGRGRGRGRDPNVDPLPRSSAQPLRRDEVAFQRQMAIHSAQSVTTRNFGGQLSTPTASTSNAPSRSSDNSAPRQRPQSTTDAMNSLTISDPANMTPEDRARAVRHGSVIERASNLVGNDSEKVAIFKAHISSYRQGSMTASRLIDAFFALFTETSAGALGTLVRELSDLFDDKSKADALRNAWQNWRAINEDYPSLPGLSGMHGATTSSSGWAHAAAASPTHHQVAAAQQHKHTTRVLKLKNSTRRAGSTAGLPTPPPTGIASISWTAAPSNPSSSSAAFPALPKAGVAGKQAARPMWIGSNEPISRPGTSAPVRRAPATNGRMAGGSEAFPALPAAAKPQSTIFGYGRGAVRRDWGNNGKDTGFSWGGDANGEAEAAASTSNGAAAGVEESGKGKKKGKKVLVAWG